MAATVSAVLIAKDERDSIARCVRSLRGLDQVVVLDTGSSDTTPLLAQREGAEVHAGTHRDPFHFSDARNEALTHATGDWILSIDADEVLRPGSVAAIRDAASRGERDGFRVLHLDRGVDTPKLRLFRRGRLRWKYRAHEELKPEGQPVRIGVLEACSMEHLPQPGREKQRSLRNIKLLRMCLEESPEHHQAVMKLGLELVAAGDVDEGIEHLHRYADTPEVLTEWRSEALCQTGRAFGKRGELENALVDLEEAHMLAPLRREPLWHSAVELIRVARLHEAKNFLQACLSIPESARGDFEWNLPAVWGRLPADTLRECNAMLRSAEERWRLMNKG